VVVVVVVIVVVVVVVVVAAVVSFSASFWTSLKTFYGTWCHVQTRSYWRQNAEVYFRIVQMSVCGCLLLLSLL
jgi:hypothetical protein